jgi:hypothetical protein
VTAPLACTECGHSPVTICADYLRRDQGLPDQHPRRWVCGCGANGLVPDPEPAPQQLRRKVWSPDRGADRHLSGR